jgi:hypothetical protein
LKLTLKKPNSLIGSNFERIPKDATTRYTDWCNRLTEKQLWLHQYRECTVIQPTWFMPREIYDAVGGYDDSEPKLPEDLIFFHKMLDLNYSIAKVDQVLFCFKFTPLAIAQVQISRKCNQQRYPSTAIVRNSNSGFGKARFGQLETIQHLGCWP